MSATGNRAAIWEADFAKGRWDFLAGALEAPRYRAIAALCRGARALDILDLGCGTGVLERALASGPGYRRYHGVDLSAVALSRARRQASLRARFTHADLTDFDAHPKPFDRVILNEVLYYVEAPETVLERALSWVVADGSVIVSMVDRPSSARVWARCADRFAPRARRRVVADDRSWTLTVIAGDATPAAR